MPWRATVPASTGKGFLLSLPTVMDKQKLLELMNTIQAGKLSRNRHFDAHLDPEVREAKMRQTRLKALAELLLSGSDHVQVSLERAQCGSSWCMELKASKWHLFWQARLLDVEMAWLKTYPPTSGYMDDLLSAT